MTFSELFETLNSIQGFEDKVVYRAFPEGEAPELPFICYLEVGTDNFLADGIVYKTINEIDIELYSKNKDLSSEHAIEQALSEKGVAWEKIETYLHEEHVFMITYTIFIEGE